MNLERARAAIARCLPPGEAVVRERQHEDGLTVSTAARSLHASLFLAGDGYEVYEVVPAVTGPAYHRDGVAMFVDTGRAFRLDLAAEMKTFYAATHASLAPLDLAHLLARFAIDGPAHQVYLPSSNLDVFPETRRLRDLPTFALPTVESGSPTTMAVAFCTYSIEQDALSGALLVRAFRWRVAATAGEIEWSCEELPVL